MSIRLRSFHSMPNLVGRLLYDPGIDNLTGRWARRYLYQKFLEKGDGTFVLGDPGGYFFRHESAQTYGPAA